MSGSYFPACSWTRSIRVLRIMGSRIVKEILSIVTFINTETKIYMGLNDPQTLKQEHETATYVNILKNVCKNYRIPFSVSLAQGGYIHKNGQYTEELTLVISMIDVQQEIVVEVSLGQILDLLRR